MKKLLFLCFFILFCFDIIAQEIRKNPQYENYLKCFEKLANNEIFSFHHGLHKEFDIKSYSLKISAKDIETGKERLIGYWNAPYGRYQLSANRKKMVFGGESSGRFQPLFLIDGIEGRVTYIMDVNYSSMTTKDLRYLLYSDGKSYGENGEIFVLIDLKELKIKRTIHWKLTPLVGGWRKIFRSLDPDYDFRIDYGVEVSLYAICYYSIAKDEIKVTLDDTAIEDERILRREKIIPEEVGW